MFLNKSLSSIPIDDINFLIYLLGGLLSADYIFSFHVFNHDGPHYLISGVYYLHLYLATAFLFADVALFELLSRLEDDS